ncbi:MAG: hypothetical protein R3C62_13035 [Chloroflexota bacterium]
MENSRQEILELLGKGKITAVEAAEMLAAVGREPVAEKAPEPEPVKAEIPVEEEPMPVAEIKKSSGGDPRWLRIRVRNLQTGKNKVSVNLPLGMFRFGLGMAQKFSGGLIDFDIDDMLAAIQQQGDGVLVDVQDEDGNEHVQIVVG